MTSQFHNLNPPGSSRRHLRTAASILSRVAQPARRLVSAFASRFANRQFVFAIATVAILSAKLVHVYAHLTALSRHDVLRWGPSFFAQDTAFLLFIRLLLDTHIFASLRWLRIIAATFASLLILFILVLAAVNTSFFVIAGSELHWRNIDLASDSSSWKLMLTGLVTCILVLAGVLCISWIVQDIFFGLAGLALDILKWPFAFVRNRFPTRQNPPQSIKYSHIPQHDLEGASELVSKEGDDVSSSVSETPPVSKWMVGLYLLVGLSLFIQLSLSVARPDESSLTFMSWTLPLLPFVDFARSSPNLAGLLPFHGNSINLSWDNRTALVEPVHFDWLPKDTPIPGFEDWYEEGRKHYSASEDPLKISNLDDEIIPGLRGKLADVPIRHVMIIELESTRKDVFPIKKNGFIWEQLASSFGNKSLPEEVQKMLATLSPTANVLTGDYDDGFEHKEKKRRGGINANNVHTTSTYTLKSLTGTLCGLSPLVADFNVEYLNHIYQPCLPNILEAFNYNLDQGKGVAKDDFTSFKWKSWFMQSVTENFDKQDQLMVKFGFPKNNTITKEYLKSEDAKFGAANVADINYYGMPEVTVEDYVRDAFKSAKENDERVFLTHLTSTTHHPFGLPENETYVPLAKEGTLRLDNLSRYLNAVGYADRWLQKILDILDEEGVADETLLVLVGDHGLSIPENDGITPYYNSNVGSFHVPLVVSHPKLPSVDIDDAAVSLQILPTILDLLVETGSLSKSQTHAAQDLVRNYEGQSLLRPLIDSNNETGQANWQFTVMNPGRATLAVRDAQQPHWRLTVPIVENTEWRFTDLTLDPHEEDPILSFGFISLLRKIERRHGIAASKWAEEGAFMTRWWVEENSHRWQYDPSQ